MFILPLRFLKFWYPDSLEIFIRSWHNLLTVIEEDLAVGLMWKLLFTPLFHDSSFVGRILSFGFRLFRIILGLLAFLVVTLIVFLIALVWFLAPIVWIFAPSGLKYLDFAILLLGLSLFIHGIIYIPQTTIWQIKSSKDIWKATKLKPNKINWNSLINSIEVRIYLESLELLPNKFGPQEVKLDPQILEEAFRLVKNSNAKYITESYIWTAFMLSLPGIESALLKLDLQVKDLEEALKFLEHRKNNWRRVYIWDEEFATKHLKGVNRGWLSAPTPLLDSISTDLTKVAASQGFPAFIGRKHIINEAISILSQEKDRNVLLVGSAGSGKSALVNNLARMIVLGDAPQALATKRIVSLDLSKFLSWIENEGDLAARIKEVFDEVAFVQDVVIFIDELHALGEGDAKNDYNFYALLAPYLESDKFQFIATTEPENYAKVIEKNNNFARIFHRLEVPPASIEDTTQIIQQRAIDLMRYKKMKVSYLAVKELVNDSVKYVHDRVLPDAALFVLEEVITQSKDGIIDKLLVKQIFSTLTKIPSIEINPNEISLLLNIEQEFAKKIIGQTDAVKAIADTLRRSSTALRDQNKPIGSFLFLGPTGVGKTELAKTLAKIYFKNEASFIQFDMSEYQNTDSINRLIGGGDNLGELTEAIKHNPYALILLDEFEKADSKILTIFLQVLEEGRLTDSSGKHISFTNSIVIATSNVASLVIAEGIKQGQKFEDIKEKVKVELLKQFKPELVNRFDEIVIFKPLNKNEIEQIVNLKISDLKLKLKDEGYLVEFTPDLVISLAEKGYDQVLGARPLKRYIQDQIEAKLARMILENQLKKGEILTLDSQILN